MVYKLFNGKRLVHQLVYDVAYGIPLVYHLVTVRSKVYTWYTNGIPFAYYIVFSIQTVYHLLIKSFLVYQRYTICIPYNVSRHFSTPLMHIRYQGHRSCHWCHLPGFKCKGLQRMVFNKHRRYLDDEDPARTDPTYGEPDQDTPSPAARSHDETVAAGLAADAWQGTKKDHPKHKSSIKWWCPLSILAFFCLVKDFCPDTMHIIKDFWQLHYIPLFKGKRVPKPMKGQKPQLKKNAKGSTTAAMRREHSVKLAAWNIATARHADATEVITMRTNSIYTT